MEDELEMRKRHHAENYETFNIKHTQTPIITIIIIIHAFMHLSISTRTVGALSGLGFDAVTAVDATGDGDTAGVAAGLRVGEGGVVGFAPSFFKIGCTLAGSLLVLLLSSAAAALVVVVVVVVGALRLVGCGGNRVSNVRALFSPHDTDFLVCLSALLSTR